MSSSLDELGTERWLTATTEEAKATVVSVQEQISTKVGKLTKHSEADMVEMLIYNSP
jgi:hypothetical protein